MHRFLCQVVARNLPAEPLNLHAELLNSLSQFEEETVQIWKNMRFCRKQQTFEDKQLFLYEKSKHLKMDRHSGLEENEAHFRAWFRVLHYI